jgi:hypothetical protein
MMVNAVDESSPIKIIYLLNLMKIIHDIKNNKNQL